MTVMDLIDVLKKYPLNAIVLVGNEPCSGELAVEKLTDVFQYDNGEVVLYSDDL